MPEIATPDGVLYIRSIPHLTKTRFKQWCAGEEVSMTDVITNVMDAISSGKYKPPLGDIRKAKKN